MERRGNANSQIRVPTEIRPWSQPCRSQRVSPAKTSYTCPTVLAQTQAFNQQVQSSQDETEDKLCLPNPSSCANYVFVSDVHFHSTSVHSKTTQNVSAVVGVETPEVVSIWTVIWKDLRCLFPATGFPMNYQGKENAIQPHRWAGLSLQAVDMKNCPKMVFPAEDQLLLWNWFFSENSLGWRNQPQEGLHCSHFFPSDFLYERQDVSCIWF